MAADPWMDAMRRGDFAAAWQVADAHLGDPPGDPQHVPRHLQRVWRGQPLAGRRVLVRCYHGLGDTVQFLRYVPALARVAREVTLWAQPALLPLVDGLPGLTRALPLHDGTPDADYDVDVEVMELPHVLRTTPATIPVDVPYLAAPAGDACPPGTLGLCWRAGAWDATRSMAVRHARAIAGAWPGPVAVLQPALESADLGGFAVAPPRSVAALASLIAQLPLVVTVDTLAAHLGGALGRPTWVLLPAAADWRWMRDRDDSPWYPTMRLFRQRRPGDWGPVVDDVRAALAARQMLAGADPAHRSVSAGRCDT